MTINTQRPTTYGTFTISTESAEVLKELRGWKALQDRVDQAYHTGIQRVKTQTKTVGSTIADATQLVVKTVKGLADGASTDNPHANDRILI